MPMISRAPRLRSAGVEQLTDRPLADDHDVLVEHAGQFLEREDHRAQRLGQQRLLGRAAMIERNGALFAERVALVQTTLTDRHRQHAIARRETLARCGDHGAHHLVQRIADRLRIYGVRRIEIRQIRTAQAGQMRLEQDLPGRRRFIELGLRNVDKCDLTSGENMSSEQRTLSKKGTSDL